MSLADQTWRKNSPIIHCSHSAVPQPGSLAVKRLLNIPFVGGRAAPTRAHQVACQEQPEVNNKGSQHGPPIKCPTLSPARSHLAESIPHCTPWRDLRVSKTPTVVYSLLREPRSASDLLSLAILLLSAPRTEAQQQGAAVCERQTDASDHSDCWPHLKT